MRLGTLSLTHALQRFVKCVLAASEAGFRLSTFLTNATTPIESKGASQPATSADAMVVVVIPCLWKVLASSMTGGDAHRVHKAEAGVEGATRKPTLTQLRGRRARECFEARATRRSWPATQRPREDASDVTSVSNCSGVQAQHLTVELSGARAGV